jgi:radical SAM protein with 4Fe4S-binding SPASM domain
MSTVNSLQAMEMFSPLWGKVPKEHLRYLAHLLENEKPHKFRDQIHLNTFFPPYPSKAFDRFCEAIVSRKRVPLSLYLAITDRCPFHCSHCSYAGRETGRMSHETLLNVIEQIKNIGTCTLGLTGGEPLLRDDLEELLAAASPDMATLVFTTGFGLTDARAKKLSASGVTCITIGLESTKAEEHDAVRGLAGSFDAARRAIGMLRSAGIYTAISTIGKREKIISGELDRMYALGSEWGVNEFRVIAPVATGAMVTCAASMLSKEEYQALFDFHVSHNTTGGDGPVVASFAYLESEKLFGCGAGYHHVFIDANGEVCPCDLTPLSFGNVNKTPLAEIWSRMGKLFDKPRCHCLMGKIAETGKLAGCENLPLPVEESEKICPSRRPDDPIPEGYRLLLQK